jgi:UMF1 family MFS transporter
LFQLSGKVTSFLGPMLLGVVTVAAGSQRAGVATILIFLISGAALLARVDEKRGIAAGSGSLT